MTAETREEMERTPDDDIADQRIQAAYDAQPLPPHDPVDAALRAWRRTVRLGDQTMRQTFAAGFAAGLARAQAPADPFVCDICGQPAIIGLRKNPGARLRRWCADHFPEVERDA